MKRQELAGQTAIVTGAAAGIGLAIAHELSARGAAVEIWDNRPEAFDAAAAGFDPAVVRRVDVADGAAVQAAFDAAVARAGQVEILVNNAGINGPVVPSWDYPLADWHRVIAINLTGVFHGCRSAIPHMRSSGYGRILNIASMAGKDGVPMISAYSAAKAGVIGLTKSIAKELATDGITVNAIAPAMAETGLQAQMTPEHIAAMKAKIPMGRFLRMDEIARMAAFILGPDCTFTTGFTFDLSGGRTTY